MTVFILHHAQIDSEGNLSINCKKYSSIEEAKTAQADLINSFRILVNHTPEDSIFEEIGTFNRLAIKSSPAEIQSHIEKFEF